MGKQRPYVSDLMSRQQGYERKTVIDVRHTVHALRVGVEHDTGFLADLLERAAATIEVLGGRLQRIEAGLQSVHDAVDRVLLTGRWMQAFEPTVAHFVRESSSKSECGVGRMSLTPVAGDLPCCSNCLRKLGL